MPRACRRCVACLFAALLPCCHVRHGIGRRSRIKRARAEHPQMLPRWAASSARAAMGAYAEVPPIVLLAGVPLTSGFSRALLFLLVNPYIRERRDDGVEALAQNAAHERRACLGALRPVCDGRNTPQGVLSARRARATSCSGLRGEAIASSQLPPLGVPVAQWRARKLADMLV